MLNIILRKKELYQELFYVQLEAYNKDDLNCKNGSSDKLLYITKIRNPNWGIRLMKIKVIHETDTDSISLCPGLSHVGCQKQGQLITIYVPSGKQEYWKGDISTVNVRTCIDSDCSISDFNVSSKIEVELYTREENENYYGRKTIETNMYVEIL